MAQWDDSENTGSTDPGANGDWWSQNQPAAPARQTGPVTDPHDPRLSDATYASDPEVLKFLNGIYGPGGTALTKPPNSPGWDPQAQAWLPAQQQTPVNPNPVTNTTGNTGAVPMGVPSSGFGAAPAPYQSDPNAPVYQPMGTYVPPTWTGGDYVNPTEADLLASPGYAARLAAGQQARERSAAAQGTILNGGTVKALDRSAQDYATNEYQTLRNNTYDAYVQKYKQFTDAAGMDLNARTVNANENQNTFANRTATYNTGNTRRLSDYVTNVTNNRNSELDYWNRLQDLNATGANLAGNSR